MTEADKARQPGYYWVRFEVSPDWLVALWLQGEGWFVVADLGCYSSDDLAGIDERRLARRPEAKAIENTMGHISKFGPW